MKKVSESTIGRLSVYLRRLEELHLEGVATLSSEELALHCGTSAAQVRKDFSFFGTFGKRGMGYDTGELIAALKSILGLERRWRVALVGAGKIGAALFAYQDFQRQGFFIESVFDSDSAKVGQRWNGLVVRHDAELDEALLSGAVDIAIIAVPGEVAQGVVDRVINAGVKAILNFAPVKLRVPNHVALKNVNMAVELEGLSFALANSGGIDRGQPSRAAAARN